MLYTIWNVLIYKHILVHLISNGLLTYDLFVADEPAVQSVRRAGGWFSFWGIYMWRLQGEFVTMSERQPKSIFYIIHLWQLWETVEMRFRTFRRQDVQKMISILGFTFTQSEIENIITVIKIQFEKIIDF